MAKLLADKWAQAQAQDFKCKRCGYHLYSGEYEFSPSEKSVICLTCEKNIFKKKPTKCKNREEFRWEK